MRAPFCLFVAVHLIVILLASCATPLLPHQWPAGYYPPGSRECEWTDENGHRTVYKNGCIVEQHDEDRPMVDARGVQYIYMTDAARTTIVKPFNPLRCEEGDPAKAGEATRLFRLAGLAGITPDGEHDLICSHDRGSGRWICREIDNCRRRKCRGPYEWVPELGARACVLEPSATNASHP